MDAFVTPLVTLRKQSDMKPTFNFRASANVTRQQLACKSYKPYLGFGNSRKEKLTYCCLSEQLLECTKEWVLPLWNAPAIIGKVSAKQVQLQVLNTI